MRTRAELIEAIRADQRFWREFAAEVGPDRYTEPGPMGEWSFGDLAGHLLGWRERTIGRIEGFARGEAEPPPPWPAELDDDDVINDWIHEQHAGRPPEALVAAYDASYDRLVAAIEALPDEALADPGAFRWLGGPLADADFTGHLHDEHVASVRAWLASRAEGRTAPRGRIRRFDHVGITVADLDAATAFFVALGLEVEGRTFVEGEFIDTVIGIPDARTEIVMLRPPGGGSGLELARFLRPAHRPGTLGAMANEVGLRNLGFEVDDLQAALDQLAADGYGLVGGVAQYEDLWRMAHVRGPEGIVVSLSERVT